MSTHIIYDVQIVRMPLQSDQSTEDFYGFFVLSGSSNSSDAWGSTTRRSRSWGMIYGGTKAELIAYAIDWSGHFRGGNTTWRSKGHSGSLKPQQWIRKIRNAIEQAATVEFGRMGQTSASAGPLVFHGKNDFAGQSIHQLIEIIKAFNNKNPGSTLWQFLHVVGPDR